MAGQEDDNISMPWNFQHNLHVDENMGGLPPSWSSSLQEAGFTEEDIAALQARRMRSPTLEPILTSTTPRKSSLPRAQTDAAYTSSPSSSISGHGAQFQQRPQGEAARRKMSDASSVFGGSESQFVMLTGQNAGQNVSSGMSSATSRLRSGSNASASNPASFVDMGDSDGESSNHHHSYHYTPQRPRASPQSGSRGVPASPPPAYGLAGPPRLDIPTLSIEDDGGDSDLEVHESKRDTIVPSGSKRDTVTPSSSSKRDTVIASSSKRDTIKAPTAPSKKPSLTDLVRSATMSTISSPRSPRFGRSPSTRSKKMPAQEERDEEEEERRDTVPMPSLRATPAARPASPPKHGRRRSKRFSVLPPRLSLDTSALGGDLSSWSASLFSSMSSDGDESSSPFAGGQQSALDKLNGTKTTREGDRKGLPPMATGSATRKPQMVGEKAGLPASPRPTAGTPVRSATNGPAVPSRFAQTSSGASSVPSLARSQTAPIPAGQLTVDTARSNAPAAVERSSSSPSPAVTTPQSAAAFHAAYKTGRNERPRPAPLDAEALKSDDAPTSAGTEGRMSEDELPPAGTPLWNELIGMVTPPTGRVDAPKSVSSSASIRAPQSPNIPLRPPHQNASLSPSATAFASPLPSPTGDASRPTSPLLSVLRENNANRNSGSTVRSDRDSNVTVTAEVVRAAVVTYSRAMVVPTSSGSSSNSSLVKKESGGSPAASAPEPPRIVPVSPVGRVSPAPKSPIGTPTGSQEVQIPSPLQPSPLPSAWKKEFQTSKLEPIPSPEQLQTPMGSDNGRDEGMEDENETANVGDTLASAGRPRIVVSGIPASASSISLKSASAGTPSPASATSSVPAYRGWLMDVLAPLEEFVDPSVDPHALYADLREVAEGESGSVFAARVLPQTPAARAKARHGKKDSSPSANAQAVAIKCIPISPSGSPKIEDLKRELELMRSVGHPNILTMDALFVDLLEDSLWIRMELMETSLADVIGLIGEGIQLTEDIMARFASDILSALDYLQTLRIAHRDVRSDNMLLNSSGVLKLSDFSNAVRATSPNFTCSDPVGVVYWQAPEIRKGLYDPLKVDTFSLGATVWEMAESQPPFSEVEDINQVSDTWPPLSQSEDYSRSFHDFLQLSSLPPSSRPAPEDLLNTPFIRGAAPRTDVLRLLSQCKSIEEEMQQ